jgi:hypothetical protein
MANTDVIRKQWVAWHYSIKENRTHLFQELIKKWCDVTTGQIHLNKNLQYILNNNGGIGPLILLLTMRNRWLIADMIGEEAAKEAAGMVGTGKATEWHKTLNSLKKDSTKLKALKQFLVHLEIHGNKPNMGDAASEVVLSHSKFGKNINYFVMFQIERVRRIRAKANPGNNNLEICKKILYSLRVNENIDDVFGGIYIPTSALKSTINLQLALCSARTGDHKNTLELSKKVINDLESDHPQSFEGIKQLHLWWAYTMQARVYLVCHYRDELNDVEKKIKQLVINMSADFEQYVRKLSPAEETKGDFWAVGKRGRPLDAKNPPNLYDALNWYHGALATYINSEIDPKKKFNISAIAKIMKINLNDSDDGGDKKHWGILKKEQISNRKERLNKMLPIAISGNERLSGPVVGQPLFFEHTVLTKEKIRERLLAIGFSSVLQINMARERNHRMLPLILILIATDSLAKISWLGREGMRERRAKQSLEAKGMDIEEKGRDKRARGEKEINEKRKGDKEDLDSITHHLKMVFAGVQNGLKKSLPMYENSELVQWVDSIYECLVTFCKKIPDINIETKKSEEGDFKQKVGEEEVAWKELLDICEGAIGWRKISQKSEFLKKLNTILQESQNLPEKHERDFVKMGKLTEKYDMDESLISLRINHITLKAIDDELKEKVSEARKGRKEDVIRGELHEHYRKIKAGNLAGKDKEKLENACKTLRYELNIAAKWSCLSLDSAPTTQIWWPEGKGKGVKETSNIAVTDHSRSVQEGGRLHWTKDQMQYPEDTRIIFKDFRNNDVEISKKVIDEIAKNFTSKIDWDKHMALKNKTPAIVFEKIYLGNREEICYSQKREGHYQTIIRMCESLAKKGRLKRGVKIKQCPPSWWLHPSTVGSDTAIHLFKVKFKDDGPSSPIFYDGFPFSAEIGIDNVSPYSKGPGEKNFVGK